MVTTRCSLDDATAGGGKERLVGDTAGGTQGTGVLDLITSMAAKTLALSFRCCSTNKLHASVQATICVVFPLRSLAFDSKSASHASHFETFSRSDPISERKLLREEHELMGRDGE